MEYKDNDWIVRENQEQREREQILREGMGMRAIKEISQEDYLKYQEAKRRSLEKRERERIKKNIKLQRTLAGVFAAAHLVLIGTLHLNKFSGRIDTLPESQVQIDYDGVYHNQGIQIYHNEKNWKEVNDKQVMIPEEIAKDLSLLSEINRKYALYDITHEMKVGSILIDDFKSTENYNNLKVIVKELSKLVGKTDTNFTNVETFNEVVVRYGYVNYQAFAKACSEQIEILNSAENDVIKGVNK